MAKLSSPTKKLGLPKEKAAEAEEDKKDEKDDLKEKSIVLGSGDEDAKDGLSPRSPMSDEEGG